MPWKDKSKVREWYAKNRDRILKENQAKRDANRERVRELFREYSRKNATHIAARKARDRKNNPELFATYDRNKHLRKIAEKEALATRPRPDRCEICETVGKVVWDHCHTTGLFRGWLCARCNRFLSWHERFSKEASEYLESFKCLTSKPRLMDT